MYSFLTIFNMYFIFLIKRYMKTFTTAGKYQYQFSSVGDVLKIELNLCKSTTQYIEHFEI